jgi:hypothetical protein
VITCIANHSTGGSFQLFEDKKLVWDRFRGRLLPEEDRVEVRDLAGLDELASSLMQAKWRFNTRQSYNRWFRVWMTFSEVWQCDALPAKECWLKRFFTFLTLDYAASTVQICACAVAAVHKLNGLRDPITAELKVLLKAIEAVGKCGTRSKKFIVDAAFIVSMCQDFLKEYPVFDCEVFNPWQTVTRSKDMSVMWLRGVALILLGLEIGARPSELVNMTACCWQDRKDGSVFVKVILAKNSKNGEVTGAVLVRGEGDFNSSYSAISFFEEFYFPFMAAQGLGVSSQCIADEFRTSICPECSPLFVSWSRNKLKRGEALPVSVSQITDSVKKWADRIGREAKNYSAVSFRRGSVSLAAAEKVCRNIRKKHCRWKSEGMQDVYTEVSSAEAMEFGMALRKAVSKSKRSRKKGRVMFSDFQT